MLIERGLDAMGASKPAANKVELAKDAVAHAAMLPLRKDLLEMSVIIDIVFS
jgi:hypothetical protein